MNKESGRYNENMIYTQKILVTKKLFLKLLVKTLFGNFFGQSNN